MKPVAPSAAGKTAWRQVARQCDGDTGNILSSHASNGAAAASPDKAGAPSGADAYPQPLQAHERKGIEQRINRLAPAARAGDQASRRQLQGEAVRLNDIQVHSNQALMSMSPGSDTASSMFDRASNLGWASARHRDVQNILNESLGVKKFREPHDSNDSSRGKGDASDANVFTQGDHVVLQAGSNDDNIVADHNDDGSVTVEVNGYLSKQGKVMKGKKFTFTAAQASGLVLRGGDGNDVIKVKDSDTFSVGLTIQGGAGNDLIVAGSGNDRLSGGAGNDQIDANGGDDVVYGGDGDDYIGGGLGSDTLYGQSGNDAVYGGSGDDELIGGRGRDYLEGYLGDDTLLGGQSMLSGLVSSKTPVEGDNDVLSGGRGDDRLYGGAGNDVVYTVVGKDKVYNFAGQDRVYGETKDDSITNARGAQTSVSSVDVDLQAGTRSLPVKPIDPSAGSAEDVKADLDMLRSSPTGQRMLNALDKAYETKSGNKGPPTTTLDVFNIHGQLAKYESEVSSFISPGGRPGKPGSGMIRFSPSTRFVPIALPKILVSPRIPSIDSDETPANSNFPITTLYHELAHAYAQVNGIQQPGDYNGPNLSDSVSKPPTANYERQAVGLEPSINPPVLTENGLRKEIGSVARLNYSDYSELYPADVGYPTVDNSR